MLFKVIIRLLLQFTQFDIIYKFHQSLIILMLFLFRSKMFSNVNILYEKKIQSQLFQIFGMTKALENATTN